MTAKPSKKVIKKIEEKIKMEQENDIQKAAKEINDILIKYGLAMQPTIEVYKVKQESPVVAAGSGEIPSDLAEKLMAPAKIMPDLQGLTPQEGIVTNPSVDDTIMAKILKPNGDEIRG